MMDDEHMKEGKIIELKTTTGFFCLCKRKTLLADTFDFFAQARPQM
jgi:hypothetical protein